MALTELTAPGRMMGFREDVSGGCRQLGMEWWRPRVRASVPKTTPRFGDLLEGLIGHSI